MSKRKNTESVNEQPIENTSETIETTEEKQQKVSRKTIIPFVAKLSDSLIKMENVISEMPESGAKKSFGLTVSALRKKYDKFTAGALVVVQGETLSNDEKEMLENYRKTKNV